MSERLLLVIVFTVNNEQMDVVILTMFLNEWDLIGSSAAREILLRMMKMRMKLVK